RRWVLPAAAFGRSSGTCAAHVYGGEAPSADPAVPRRSRTRAPRPRRPVPARARSRSHGVGAWRPTAEVLPAEHERAGKRERDRDHEEEEAGREGAARIDAEA